MNNSFSEIIRGIEFSSSQQKVILESDKLNVSKKIRYNRPATVIISNKRCIRAALEYPNDKVCVLNFASFTNPGGGVKNGVRGQEESICRCSNLYPCLDSARDKFYNQHKRELRIGNLDNRYNSDCIYTPDVIIFKTDELIPKPLDTSYWRRIDVISCSAPNLLKLRRDLSYKDLLDIHRVRAERILRIAKGNNIDVLILGAFGCGKSKNPPDVVAESYALALMKYVYDFKVIEFAIYDENDSINYNVFKERLKDYERP